MTLQLSDTELDILIKRAFDHTKLPPDRDPPWVDPLLRGVLVTAGVLPRPQNVELAWAAFRRYVRKRFNAPRNPS